MVWEKMIAMRVWIGGIVMTALAASAAGGDAARPADAAPPDASPPSNVAASSDTSLPAPYRVLLSRSIFAAGGKSSDAAAQAPSLPPEANLALKGVVQDDQQFTAFVEDLPQKRVLQLRVGDAVARGRVVAITLHGLQYEASGRMTRVAIGQALGGPGVATTELPSPPPAAPPVGAQPRPRHPSSVAEAR
jgi:hypothetical protein